MDKLELSLQFLPPALAWVGTLLLTIWRKDALGLSSIPTQVLAVLELAWLLGAMSIALWASNSQLPVLLAIEPSRLYGLLVASALVLSFAASIGIVLDHQTFACKLRVEHLESSLRFLLSNSQFQAAGGEPVKKNILEQIAGVTIQLLAAKKIQRRRETRQIVVFLLAVLLGQGVAIYTLSGLAAAVGAAKESFILVEIPEQKENPTALLHQYVPGGGTIRSDDAKDIQRTAVQIFGGKFLVIPAEVVSNAQDSIAYDLEIGNTVYELPTKLLQQYRPQSLVDYYILQTS